MTAARRVVHLLSSLALVTGCAVLTLNLRTIPKVELVTVVAAAIYVQAANLAQLQLYSTSPSISSHVIRPLAMNGIFSRLTIRIFLFSSLVLSIVVPWIWLLAFNPSLDERMMLGPHLFAMMAQILFEFWSFRPYVSLVVRLAIPVGFVAYRLRLLMQWVQAAYQVDLSIRSHLFMLVLASANLIFWSIMLFYVLLLKVCPPYFSSSLNIKQHPSAIDSKHRNVITSHVST